jgi:hypothetical protein
VRGLWIVIVLGFAGLIAVTLAYRNAPPIPALVVDARGVTLFSGDDIRDGQAVGDLLRRNDIVQVLDVRTVPRSRHNPRFNLDALPASLHAAGIAYTHLPGLGGLRHARADSPNLGWRNLSFRGYADTCTRSVQRER